MPRLPQPGSDAGNWGNILNDFLSTTHDTNGNLKPGSVGTAALADGAVTLAKLAINNAPNAGQTLSFDGTDLSWSTPSGSGSVPDATTSVKGLIQLGGDLGGTAAAPTVPGLAAKADSSNVVALTGTQTVTGSKNFTGGLLSAGAVVVTTGDARLTDQRTPVDGSVTTVKLANVNVTTAKIADDAITEPKLSAANNPTSGQVLSYNGTNFTWVAQASGSTDPTVGGDLTGTASNAQIASGAVGPTELATNAVTSAKITDANVTTAKIADDAITEPKLAISNTPTSTQVLSWNGTALAWANPTSGGAGDPIMGGDLNGVASNAQLGAGVVGSNELATNAVTSVKITDANVTTAKIADGNVTSIKIADANVITTKIADANVTTVKIADSSITEPKLAASNAPSTNQVLAWDGTNLTWTTPAGGGGAAWNAVARSTTYTASSGDFVVCDTTTSGFTVTLPAPANGSYVTVKKKTNNVNAILVAPPSGTIDAGPSSSSTISVNNYGQVADFLADGTTWHQVG
jgi:hypothetical protein